MRKLLWFLEGIKTSKFFPHKNIFHRPQVKSDYMSLPSPSKVRKNYRSIFEFWFPFAGSHRENICTSVLSRRRIISLYTVERKNYVFSDINNLLMNVNPPQSRYLCFEFVSRPIAKTHLRIDFSWNFRWKKKKYPMVNIFPWKVFAYEPKSLRLLR